MPGHPDSGTAAVVSWQAAQAVVVRGFPASGR